MRKKTLDVGALKRVSKRNRTRAKYISAVLRKAKPCAVSFALLAELMTETYSPLGGTPNRLRLIGILQQLKDDGNVAECDGAYSWIGRIR